MTYDLQAFDHSLTELAISGGRRVGIVGLNNMTGPLASYCSAQGFEVVAIFDDNATGGRNQHGLAHLPLVEIKTVNPDAIILATVTDRKRMKEDVYRLKGPVYKGLIAVADGHDTRDLYAEMYQAVPEITAMHNLHQGMPAVVIGNGPSLLKTDPRELTNAITFGCNSIFLLDEFTPTYYFVEDVLVAEDRAAIINDLPWTKFFPKDLSRFLTNGTFFNVNRVQWINFFSEDFALGIEMNATVTYTMLHAAFYFGCNPVYLIGVDHNYVINDADIERDNTVFTSKLDDPNHFHPDYFGKGLRWHDPRVDRMEAAYRLARRSFAANGREVFNATAGGCLDVFTRTPFDVKRMQRRTAP